jgi:hypothetical protein
VTRFGSHLWICGQRIALPTTPQAQPPQKRSIDALQKAVTLTRQQHLASSMNAETRYFPDSRENSILVVNKFPSGTEYLLFNQSLRSRWPSLPAAE